MTLPPCPIAGHDNPHHWHDKPTGDVNAWRHGAYLCATEDPYTSRCYSAHVPEPTEPAPTREPCCCNINCGDYCDKCHGAPGEWRCKRHRREFGDMPTPTAPDLEVPPEPTPDPDEWVLAPEGATMPAGTVVREECRVISKIGLTVGGEQFYVRRSDLDAILKPAPTPAEKLAEALCATYTPDGDEPAWTPADVLAALDAAGLTLAERGEK